MGKRQSSLRARPRGGFFALAFVALVLKVLAPPGFMVAPGQPFPIVICTGHGPAVAAPTKGGDPVNKSKPDAPCAFSGNGVGAIPPGDLHADIPTATLYQILVSSAPADLTPGRGLAAPPPPSQGPPVIL